MLHAAGARRHLATHAVRSSFNDIFSDIPGDVRDGIQTKQWEREDVCYWVKNDGNDWSLNLPPAYYPPGEFGNKDLVYRAPWISKVRAQFFAPPRQLLTLHRWVVAFCTDQPHSGPRNSSSLRRRVTAINGMQMLLSDFSQRAACWYVLIISYHNLGLPSTRLVSLSALIAFSRPWERLPRMTSLESIDGSGTSLAKHWCAVRNGPSALSTPSPRYCHLASAKRSLGSL